MKQESAWEVLPPASTPRPRAAAAPQSAWEVLPPARATPAPRGGRSGGRGAAPPPAAPAADEYDTPMIRDVQRTEEGTTYVLRDLAPDDTPESLTASGRYLNPATNTWEYPRDIEDVEVTRQPLEVLPLVRPAAAPMDPRYRSQAAMAAGALRGVGRVTQGLRTFAARGLGMIPGLRDASEFEVNRARGMSALMDEANAPYREANTFANQAGQFLGETAATAPLGMGAGAGLRSGGRALAGVAPRVGRALERVGEATMSGGFLPSAVRPPAAGMAPSVGERLGNLAVRGAGGAISGGAQTAVLSEEDAAAGAAIGALLPTVAARPAKYALNRLLDGFQLLSGQMGAARASEIVRRSLGIDYDAAVAALRSAPEGVTAQQALVDAGVEPAAFMGVGAAVRGAEPDAFLAIEARQAAARQAPIDRLAGGENLTAAQLAARNEKEALRAATVPMQQAELAAADASGALDVAPVSAALMQQADAPGVGTTNSRVLAEIASALEALAERRGGVASADDLYAFRKDDLDDIISRALSGQRGGDITSQAARRADLVRSTQQMLDDAIEAAGGTGWRQYLETYSSGMRSVERQNMMGVAGGLLRENPNTFVRLAEGNAPETVSGVFGGNRIDLANQMNPTGVGPSGMDALTDAARQIRRDERIGVLANEGRGLAREMLTPGRSPFRHTRNVLSFGSPTRAAALEFASMLVDAKVTPQVRRALAEAYQSGANMDELLNMMPLATRAQMARNMMNPAFWSHLTGAATNAMAQ